MPIRDPKNTIIATNRKAFYDYIVLERLEAGIKLTGTEVKSCRDRHVTLQDSYVRIDNARQVFAHGIRIAPYEHGGSFNHRDNGMRKLLLNRNEALKFSQQVKLKGLAIIPLTMYFKHGLVKLEIGLCQGKTHGDKRETIRKRQDLLEARRSLTGR